MKRHISGGGFIGQTPAGSIGDIPNGGFTGSMTTGGFIGEMPIWIIGDMGGGGFVGQTPVGG